MLLATSGGVALPRSAYDPVDNAGLLRLFSFPALR
jgi:hypothetical protein